MKNELVSLLVRHCAAGVAAGWLSLALLLWTDVGRVGTLIAASDLWPLPLLMLLAGFAVTFGSAAMGAAVMGLGRDVGPEALDGGQSVVRQSLITAGARPRRAVSGGRPRP